MSAQEHFSENQTDSDHQLIRNFQAGDKRAFDELVLLYQDKVCSLCFWYVGNEMDANDTAQDVFIKILGSLNSFRFESAFSTWLYRITVNTCKNRLNSLEFRWRKWLTFLTDNDDHGQAGGVKLASNSPDPAKVLEKKERMLLCQQAIKTLDNKKRDIIILRDIEGLTYEEISMVTDLKTGTVKSKLARARAELKEKLEKGRVG